MVALIKGRKAPPFELIGTDSKRYNLHLAASATNCVVLAFFKVSCPTCIYSLPFIERLHQRHPGANIWGVSQDDLFATSAFAAEHNLSLPLLLDGDLSVTVEYELTNVPTLFLVDKNLSVSHTSVGFVRADLEEINAALAEQTGKSPTPLFLMEDNAPPIRPG
jgi:peroxiredoxin